MQHLEPTASYGKLFIDERNGYIGLCPSARYNAKKCQWYKITDIENPGLYCTKPRCRWDHSVMVDCEFVCDVPSQGLHIKRIIKQQIHCQHHPYNKDTNYEEWSEPGVISMMRGIITQTYINAVSNQIKQWQDKLYYLDVCIEEQARCAFMLPRDYTQETLDRQYQILKEAFEHDIRCSLIIEKYYQVLKETI
jgi:hypothetical protein